ncbi:MAG TPA: HD domain-containing protein [Spirochaetota bacterium]|nr:HD domain-containing protein [Spirochaetota bacterium]HPN82397.1 HD domain-containing protein [Spirochaetota bacterium]
MSKTAIESIVETRDKRAEQTLGEHACHFSEAKRLRSDSGRADNASIRTPFARDSDRIIHSRAYARYIDKTQVFSFFENDHITHRVLHVQFVSRIGRTIGRSLALNEDLIEAISLGHDIGHAPFGHFGEKVINTICHDEKIGCFYHNVQGVRFFHEIERNGTGINLTVQTLDGIICHNGEVLQSSYRPDRSKTPEEMLAEYRRSLVEDGVGINLVPMTLEACVVRIADVIAYIGRDIEDAIHIGLIKRSDLPPSVTGILGSDNAAIIDHLVLDLLEQSYGRDEIRFSEPVFTALKELLSFNYSYIYTNRRIMREHGKVARIIRMLYDKYHAEMQEGFVENSPFAHHCRELGPDFVKRQGPRIIIDFLAGMTDDYLINQFRSIFMPDSYGYKLNEDRAR